jgi:hypothetical protein
MPCNNYYRFEEMSGVNETSGLSSARQITDATSVVVFSPNDTSSDIMKIILTFPKREKNN